MQAAFIAEQAAQCGYCLNGMIMTIRALLNRNSHPSETEVLEALRDEDPKRYAVLNLERNSGKAEAVRRGFIAAMEHDVDYIGFWDADLATPFSELVREITIAAETTIAAPAPRNDPCTASDMGDEDCATETAGIAYCTAALTSM